LLPPRNQPTLADEENGVGMAVSLKDVARVAGVTTSTASRALGKGPVSAEARAQVLAAVKATGYRANLAARRLRTQQTQTIGVIVADIRAAFFTSVVHAVEKAAYAAGMRVMLCNAGEDPEREAMYLALMQEERVSGLILSPTPAGVERLAREPLDFPVALIDRPGPAGMFDSVMLDHAAATASLVEHLYDRGYRRIGGLFGSVSVNGAERRQGYVAAMTARGLTPAERFVMPTASGAAEAVTEWMQGPDSPEALLTSNGWLAKGALKAVRALGLSIPGDVALAGIDADDWTELVEPQITVIQQPVDAIGQEAVSMLLARIRNPAEPIRHVALQGRRIERASTAMRTRRA